MITGGQGADGGEHQHGAVQDPLGGPRQAQPTVNKKKKMPSVIKIEPEKVAEIYPRN